ncbi:(-)-alpha-pinene synthase-like [Dorcoceras hygrometricum]|uniref:(-)-alpha-pinene synthase-like n=1 Tax=Dorcoceras hygrometricum TaxID=472368 RepID=A0A2Z7BGN5_9LAMI|nr:(-)-alpha-pinene synthase-like [Dorcoceras hygrometricum]
MRRIRSCQNPSDLLVQIDGGITFPVVDLIRRSTAAYNSRARVPCESGLSQAPRRQQAAHTHRKYSQADIKDASISSLVPSSEQLIPQQIPREHSTNSPRMPTALLAHGETQQKLLESSNLPRHQTNQLVSKLVQPTAYGRESHTSHDYTTATDQLTSKLIPARAHTSTLFPKYDVGVQVQQLFSQLWQDN